MAWYSSERYGYWSVGQNLLWVWNQVPARAALQMWLSSRTRRKILLKPALARSRPVGGLRNGRARLFRGRDVTNRDGQLRRTPLARPETMTGGQAARHWERPWGWPTSPRRAARGCAAADQRECCEEREGDREAGERQRLGDAQDTAGTAAATRRELLTRNTAGRARPDRVHAAGAPAKRWR